MRLLFRTVAGLAMVFFLFSCEKKFLEIIPVTEKVEDLSIPNGGHIKFFSFPGNAVGYAASDTNFIFKTTDGGKTWNQLPIIASGVDAYSKCEFLEFYDDQNGICVMNDGYYDNLILVTANGGATWTYAAPGPLAGIIPDGKAYRCEYELSRRNCHIKVSLDKGKTFKNLITLYLGEEFVKLKVIEGTVFMLTDEGTAYGYNPQTFDTLRYHIGRPPGRGDINDFIINDYAKVAVCEGGIIKGRYFEGFGNLLENYNQHGYSYYSVDANQDFAVAVGQNTIATNLDTQDPEADWHEVFDVNGNGFTHTFYKIQFIDQEYFYVSGNQGLIWKMKI